MERAVWVPDRLSARNRPELSELSEPSDTVGGGHLISVVRRNSAR